MRSIVYMQPGAASKVLFSEEAENPQVAGHDLLVEIRAISVNPVDTKVRAGMAPPSGQSRTLGWDAAGVVRAVGPLVSLFEVGDEVYYAGDLQRPGAYSELHLVDERLVGHKPRTLSFAEAAAMPLTSITAYELLFERLGIPLDGSAGGVGSILVQLAANIAGLTVVATASRPESRRWLKNLGAHFVLDHLQPLSLELARIGMGGCDYAPPSLCIFLSLPHDPGKAPSHQGRHGAEKWNGNQPDSGLRIVCQVKPGVKIKGRCITGKTRPPAP